MNLNTKPSTGVEQLLPLNKITQQGQYVNRQTGHLLIVDENVEKALRNSSGLFNCFVAKDQSALEFTRVTENWKLPVEEVRTAVGKLNLPINF